MAVSEVDLMRRALVSGAVAASLGALGCAGTSRAAPEARAPLAFDDLPRGAGREPLLVVTPFAPSAHALWSSMRAEVTDTLDVVTLEMKSSVTVAEVGAALDTVRPVCVVLVGNQAVRVYRDLQRSRRSTPPAVIVMSSFAPQLAGDLRSATGVAYEVPAVTSVVALRQLSTRRFQKVGVVHRPELTAFVAREAELARVEQVTLRGYSLEGAVTPRAIRLGLRELLARERVDALWVLNDNALLAPESIRDAWLPEAQKSQVPVLVGVRSLVDPRLSFGSVAVVPDHAALGVQVANLLFELEDTDWSVEDRGFELPLSVETVVDMTQRRMLELRPEAEKHIDRQVATAELATAL
jgi:hypothetical protein